MVALSKTAEKLQVAQIPSEKKWVKVPHAWTGISSGPQRGSGTAV